MAITQLASLAHEKRLQIFRLLVRRYPHAVPAGEIAAAIGAKANTASSYLSTLRQAGLIEQLRDGTTLRYRAVTEEMRALLNFLSLDCCQGRPDLCLDGPQDTLPLPRIHPLSVLFICTGNSARSIMAEAILRDIGADQFTAASAGTKPAKAPHPKVLHLLSDKGHDISSLHSNALTTDTDSFDFVFTVCDTAANEPCPTFPGHPMHAHWGLPDPLTQTGSETQTDDALHQSYSALHQRIRAFAALPFETLTRLSLQHALDEIAQIAPGTPETLPT